MTEPNWERVQMVERDICYAFHELSPYGYIMGDLCWGSVYALPYWEYLMVEGLEQERTEFIRNGVMVLILAMAFETLDGAGNYIIPHMDDCRDAIESMQPQGETCEELKRIVLHALSAVALGSDTTEELERMSTWVHTEYVRGYFRQMSTSG